MITNPRQRLLLVEFPSSRGHLRGEKAFLGRKQASIQRPTQFSERSYAEGGLRGHFTFIKVSVGPVLHLVEAHVPRRRARHRIIGIFTNNAVGSRWRGLFYEGLRRRLQRMPVTMPPTSQTLEPRGSPMGYI